MGAKTEIAWTDATWNPIRGCSRVSAGCEHCYAEVVSGRFGGPGQPYEGLTRHTTNGARWTGVVREVPSAFYLPIRWKTGRRIFVNSMSDLFHESLPDEAIDRVFAVMALCPQHTFQVLTKRPERMREYMATECRGHVALGAAGRYAESIGRTDLLDFECVWPLPNVWIGTSVENQETADERLPMLLRTPAAIRFISAEPLLGPIRLFDGGCLHPVQTPHGEVLPPGSLSWVIVGGESGPGARPFHLEWAESIVEQCRDSGVACFVKQVGANPYYAGVSLRDSLAITDRKGGNWDEWWESLRVRDFPAALRAVGGASE